MVNHASAIQSSRAGWRYREGNSSFSGPTPQSLGVCAAFFCDQARSNWDAVTSAAQFHCPKLFFMYIERKFGSGSVSFLVLTAEVSLGTKSVALFRLRT